MFSKIHSPFILTIFGASGDLAKLKLFPSLFELSLQNRLPKDFFIIGYARSKKTREEFHQEFFESIQKVYHKPGVPETECKKACDRLLEHVYYFSGQYDDLEDYEKYHEYLDLITKKAKTELPKTHVAYFSVPPSIFQPIIQNLALSRKSEDDDIRIVLEKPFGEDEKSATKLFHFISRFFREDQFFLLDHYLGKNAVQSILNLRHNNAVLNLLLEGREISNIQITAHESLGLDDRAGYFDHIGIIKDMFQSHLVQILAMVTMSIPITTDAKSFHREKNAILSALDFSENVNNIYLGQYKGYRDIPGVSSDSQTETYFAAKLKIDREAWYGVPIFIRTGKKLKKKMTSVVIEFKKLPFQKENEPNRLIFELQPKEMLHIKLLNQYGQSSEFHEVGTSESIACHGKDCLPEHATLLMDVFENDRLHFLSFPEILSAWNITDTITGYIQKNSISIDEYPNATLSPEGASKIFRKKGEGWYEF